MKAHASRAIPWLFSILLFLANGCSNPTPTRDASPAPESNAVPPGKTPPATKGILRVVYPRPESTIDSRNDYHAVLLRDALERTVATHGPYELVPASEVMNELRIFKMLSSGSPDIDVMFRPTSIEDEKVLTPVRIPLDKGLLGYRIFLIRKEDQSAFTPATDLADLKKLRLGQGRDWNDVAIYEHSGFQLVTGSVYEGLFEMLVRKRFDYFPRGAEEAFPEYEERKAALPQLHVEENLVIHYPFARYIWVTKAPKGELLRERLTEGLELMIRDGSFDRAFWKYKGAAIRQANLPNRKIIQIDNPFMPPTVPLNRPELWYDPLKPQPDTAK